MFYESNQPIVAAIHPKLVEELKFRKETIEKETGRKAKGGITCFSEMAALELYYIRSSGNKIMSEVLKLKNMPIERFKVNGVEKEYVPYEYYKKILLLVSVLSKKKDQQPVRVEITKIRGLKKNEVRYFW